MESRTVLLEIENAVALVTINRPAMRNALDPETVCGLEQAWIRIRDDAGIRVAVVTGAGDDVFCAGADLKRLIPLISGARQAEDAWDRRVVAEPDLPGRAVLRNLDVGKPVIAAVNGHAIAGGMELMEGTDLRVVAETAELGLREVRWSLFPAGGSTVRLPRQVPYAVAMEILLTGDLITARRAFELGLVNRVVPRADVLDASMELAARIARNGPLAVQAIRRSARSCLGLPEDAAMKIEEALAAPVFASRDAREGPLAFIEKREPVFSGN